MPGPNLTPTDQCALLAVIDPDAYNANTYTSPYVSVVNYRRLMAICSVGDMQSSSTVDFSVRQSQTAESSPATATTIAGASITQLTKAGSDDNKQAIINLDVTALDIANGYDCAAIQLVVANAASDAAGYLFGFDPIYGTASDNDVASVDEIITL